MDTFQWLSPDNYLVKSLFIWNSDFSGKVEPMVFSPFGYNLVLKLLHLLTNNIILSVNIYWILFIYFLLVSYFQFYRIFFPREKALLATLLAFFNISVITTLYAPMVSVNIALVAFPLVFYLFYSYIFKGKSAYVLLYIVYQVLLFRVLNILIIVNLAVPFLVYVLFKEQIRNKKIYVKKVLSFWIIGFLASIMLVINLAISYKDVLGNDNVQSYNEISLSTFYKDRDRLSNTLRLTNHFSIADDNPEFPGFVYFKFSDLYMNSWFYTFVSFIFITLLVVNFRKRGTNNKMSVLMLFLLFLMFFAKTINPPFGVINSWFYSSPIFTIFFRSGSKYFMYLIIPLSVLLILYGNDRGKRVYVLILVYIISHIFLIFVYAKPVGEYWNTILPKEYLDTSRELDSLRDSGKVLLLPNSPRFAGENYYVDGYAGYTRLRSLSSKSFVSKASSFGASNEYNKLFDLLFDGTDPKYDSIDHYANIMNYRYILVEKDVVYYPKLDIEAAISTSDLIENSINKNLWEKIFSNRQATIFKFKDDLFVGKLYMSKSRVFYTRVSPVKYKLYISGLEGGEYLSFLEAYNKDWKIYINRNPSRDWCYSGELFTKSNSFECSSSENVVDLSDIHYLLEKPILHDSHGLGNYYANEWFVDTDYLKDRFSGDYYKTNIDGSIDVELTLYFKPQSYFDAGLLVSLLTITGYAVYVVCSEIADRCSNASSEASSKGSDEK